MSTVAPPSTRADRTRRPLALWTGIALAGFVVAVAIIGPFARAALAGRAARHAVPAAQLRLPAGHRPAGPRRPQPPAARRPRAAAAGRRRRPCSPTSSARRSASTPATGGRAGRDADAHDGRRHRAARDAAAARPRRGDGPGPTMIIFGIAAVQMPFVARLIRTATLEISTRGYVEAAVARGESTRSVLYARSSPGSGRRSPRPPCRA